MNTPMIKRILALLALAAFLAVLTLVPVYLYADSLYRELFSGSCANPQAQEVAVTSFELQAQENEHQTQSRIAGWLSAVASEEAVVSTQRGKLYAMQYEPVAGDADTQWAIVFHGGLGTDREQVLDVACRLSVAGYRVLTPDLYAHGKSDGNASTLGFGDAQDVHAWVDYVEKTQLGARIVLFGQDEGAAAVLSAVCEGLPESVAAAAADSASDDGVSRMLSLAGEDAYGVKGELLKLLFARRTGGNAGKISERIAGVKTPVLLIHGTGDQSVPAWQSEDIADAAGENAKLLYIEGAGHGSSRYLEPEMYYEALLGFFERAL